MIKNTLMKNIIIIISAIVFCLSCSNTETKKSSKSDIKKYIVSKEEAKIWIKSNQVFKILPTVTNDSSAQHLARVKLGKMLYFEKALSKNGNISCNSCHNLKTFGVDNEPTSPGTDGIRGGRNSPTSLNTFLHIAQFWDGRAKDVEAQAQGPILNPVEMGCPSKSWVVDKIAKNINYISLFKIAFPNQEMNYENLTSSIGYFERTLLTPSRFDKFLANDFEILTPKEKKGLKLFLDNQCQSCHMGVAIGGSLYEKFGKYDQYWKYTNAKKVDNGVFDLTNNEADRYKFKVPSLRNITKTAPYFHDGSVSDLNQVVKIMAKIQLNKELSNEDTEAIVAFLETLTGEVPKTALEL